MAVFVRNSVATPIAVVGDDEALVFGAPADGLQLVSAAAGETVERADRWAWFVALLFVVVGVGSGWLLLEVGPLESKPFVPAEGVGVFAVFYVLAQAIERALEPFSSVADGSVTTTTASTDKTKRGLEKARDDAMAKAIADRDQSATENAANAQADVAKVAKTRAVWLWGAATGLAALASGYLNLQILDAVGFAADVGGLHDGAELLVTALAVGGGTKPLHDLISKVEKSKNRDATPASMQA